MADSAHNRIEPLLEMLERRFDLRLDGPVEHLQEVRKHYEEKRQMYLRLLGEAEALKKVEYAKAFLISEAARIMILREIMPRPKTRKKRN